MQGDYHRLGWCRFASDARTRAWADHARAAARATLTDPAHAHWWDCENTWFIGVDALANDAAGTLPGGPPLAGAALDFIASEHGCLPPLHPAQVSVVLEGYPRPRRGERDAAFAYRLNRDAAHVDGVKLFGDARRRRVEEPHAWVLGVPLNQTSADAAPLVVWEGSHRIMSRAFAEAFRGHDPQDWHLADITEAYTEARREVFETCNRVTVHAVPGEAYLMHRLCLHGVAPWATSATAPQGEGRMIAYFRPEVSNWQANWLMDLGQED